jgi:hypothetical protein
MLVGEGGSVDDRPVPEVAGGMRALLTAIVAGKLTCPGWLAVTDWRALWWLWRCAVHVFLQPVRVPVELVAAVESRCGDLFGLGVLLGHDLFEHR